MTGGAAGSGGISTKFCNSSTNQCFELPWGVDIHCNGVGSSCDW